MNEAFLAQLAVAAEPEDSLLTRLAELPMLPADSCFAFLGAHDLMRVRLTASAVHVAMVDIPIDLTDLGALTNEQLMPFTRACGGGGGAGGGGAGGGNAGGSSGGGAGGGRLWHVTGLHTKVETPHQWMVNISTYRPPPTWPPASTGLHRPPPASTDPPTHRHTHPYQPLPTLTNPYQPLPTASYSYQALHGSLDMPRLLTSAQVEFTPSSPGLNLLTDDPRAFTALTKLTRLKICGRPFEHSFQSPVIGDISFVQSLTQLERLDLCNVISSHRPLCALPPPPPPPPAPLPRPASRPFRITDPLTSSPTPVVRQKWAALSPPLKVY